MKTLLLCIALIFALVAGASAQPITTDRGKTSDEVFLKIRKIDLLNHILPMLLTKDQINKLLPAIEQARGKQKQELAREDEELAKLKAQVDEAYVAAIEKGVYPKEVSTVVAAKTRQMSIARQIVLGEMIEIVEKAVTTHLNEGQRKAMIGSFAASYIAPGRKPEDITDAIRMKFFIESVLLDPLTREILIEVAAKKKED
jgi:hypothetical protein